MVNFDGKLFRAIGKGLLKAAPQTGLIFFGLRYVSQMRRENEQAFHKRKQQCGDDNKRYEAKDFAGMPFQGEKWIERRNRRQHAKYNRPGHFQCAADCALQSGAMTPMMCVNILAEHNRVIHHNAEHDNEGKKRDEANRDFQARH